MFFGECIPKLLVLLCILSEWTVFLIQRDDEHHHHHQENVLLLGAPLGIGLVIPSQSLHEHHGLLNVTHV
jgi:hypothetical protein